MIRKHTNLITNLISVPSDYPVLAHVLLGRCQAAACVLRRPPVRDAGQMRQLDGENRVTREVIIDGKKYTAQEISARILAKLKADATMKVFVP